MSEHEPAERFAHGKFSRRTLLEWSALAAAAPAAAALATSSAASADEGAEEPPRFRVLPGFPKPLPMENGRVWVTGEVAGTAVDSRDHLFIVSRRNLTDKELREAMKSPMVIEFDPDGNVVNAFTHPDDKVPDGLHGIFVDFEDNVWIAGNADAIVQKYTHDGGRLLLQIGEKRHFDSTDGTARGTPLNRSRTLLNRPSDIAVDPDNGDVFISDGYGNHRVVVFDRNGRFLRQIGEQATLSDARAGAGGKFLATVHAVNLGRDGLVYVNDRKGDRIQVFEKSGAFVRNIWIKKGVGIENPASIGTAWDMAFSPDRNQRFIFDTDGEQEVGWTLERESGNVVSGAGRSGHMAGDFTFLHTVAVDSKGDLYTGETIDGRRVQKFKRTGRGE